MNATSFHGCRSFFIGIIFLSALYANAQQSPIDSLKKVIASPDLADTLRVKALSDLCYEFLLTNSDSSLYYGQRGVALARRLKLKKQLAQSSSDLGLTYYYRGDLKTAILLWEDASLLREELHDDAGVASVEVKLGAAHFKLGNFEKSLASQTRALRKFEAQNNLLGVANALNNIGAVFESQKKFDKALEYYRLTMETYHQLKNDAQVGVTMINIGNVYYLQNVFDSAGFYWKKALVAIPEDALPQYRSIAYNNLGENYTVEKKYDSALVLIQNAVALRRKINDYQGLTSSMSNLGRIYTLQGKLPLAERTLQAALDSANRKNLVIEESKIHKNLYELYRIKKDFESALMHFENYDSVEDSLSNERSRKNLDELLLQYETEKKAQQITMQQLQLSEQQAELSRTYTLIASLAVVLALVVVILFLVRNRMRRKEVLKQQEHELRLREAFIEASIQSQENERKRFAQDLHDGLGQLLSSLRITVAKLDRESGADLRATVVQQSEKILNDMHREIRGIAFNLMPQTLIQAGVGPAFQEMATRINDLGHCRVTVNTFDLPERLSEIQEISIYRIIQEWVNNVLKYASASVIEIQMVGHPDELNITVEDNGRGFDKTQLEAGTGHGWRNILSRAKLIRAALELDSAEGQSGTTFILSIPKALLSTASPGNTVATNTQ